MVLQIIYIFKWLTWLSNDIQIISIMSPDKDVLENCLFNSEILNGTRRVQGEGRDEERERGRERRKDGRKGGRWREIFLSQI
jgi:hypothetical protein